MYQCLASDFDNRVEKRIQSIIRQMAQYGIEANYQVVGREVKELPVYRVEDNVKINLHQTSLAEVVSYEFSMPNFKVGNYTPVAVIEHNVVLNNSNVKNLVHAINNFSNIPQSWWTIDGHCDDCNDKYSRKKTIMLLNNDDSSFRQIGTSCLKKYLGISCYNVIHNYMTIDELVEEEIYIDYDYVPQKKYVETAQLLAHCIDAIAQFGGYIKDKIIEKAWDNSVENKEPSSEAVKSAEQIIEVFRNHADSMNSEFLQNVCTCVLTKYIGRSGYIAYAPVAYTKLLTKINEKNTERLSEFVGNKGDKNEFDVVVIKSTGFDGQFGYTFINVFNIKDTNNQLVWTTTTKSYEVGTQLKIKGTIKDHREYNGVKQTVLTRVKEL